MQESAEPPRCASPAPAARSPCSGCAATANWLGAAGSVDALVVPHACTVRELATLLQGGDCLREGGVLIVQAPPNVGSATESLPTLLRSLGYQLERGLTDKRREIVVARRRAAPVLRDAA